MAGRVYGWSPVDDWVHAQVAGVLAFHRFALYRPCMHAFDVLNRSPARPYSGCKGAVRFGCMLVMQGELQRGQQPLHAFLRSHGSMSRDAARPAEHRRGSCTAEPRPQQQPWARGQLRRAVQALARSPCLATAVLSSTASAGWRTMSRLAEGRQASAGRAHQVRHCHQRGQCSHFGRRRVAHLDALRRAGAALLIRPTYGTHPARAPSTPASGPGKYQRH